jgi:ATP-dependent Lon protease
MNALENKDEQFEFMEKFNAKENEGINKDAPLPSQLYLLPLTERPFFPPQTLPLILDDTHWAQTLKKISESQSRYTGLVLTKHESLADLNVDDIYSIGTLVRIHHPVHASGKIQFIAEGIRRFKIKKWISKKPPYCVEVEYPDELRVHDEMQNKAYTMAIITILKELIPLNPLYSEELKFFLNRFIPNNDPSHLADFAASLTSASKEDLQGILEIFDVNKRLRKVVSLLKKEVEVVKLQAKISQDVELKLTDQQRQFFLNEQLKAIQKELGLFKDDRTAERERIEERLHDLDLPPHAKTRIDEELDKLNVLETGSPEFSLTRNYLDIMTTLPWNHFSRDKLSLKRARQILNRDHEGLEDIKDRIIEFIATGSLRGKIGGSILLFVGPPGVGKTSIGRSIAKAVGRKFYRFSVGGMIDEAEIKGHRRTYIGAMPGKIIQALRECGTSNPIIMLDEIDKIGASYHGDPASALLEVLDPEQNRDFLDHYLDVRFDLSKILFICTANQTDTIPHPLLDRMETMHLSGYITSEKIEIAKKHLWPAQVKKSGLLRTQIKITEAAIRGVIESYAREAGVRGLEKCLSRITRKAAVKIVSNKAQKVSVGVRDLISYLGQPIFQKEKPMLGIGITTGLAWTPMGGVTLNIEVIARQSKETSFKLTGQLGDVMRESAEIAYSYIGAHLEQYGAEDKTFDNCIVHMHIPEGAIPKDGPSAGITMATALLSLAKNEKINRPLAMTGELTLTGHVLAVGGIKDKIIAARRVNIFELILPSAVKGDYTELPRHIKEGLTVHFVDHYDEVYDIVFG